VVDKLTPERRSFNMSRIRGKDMKPELAVRRMIHAMGFRYRLHDGRLPGKPDLVFSSKRKVIFVHGCFWHQHSDSACRHGRRPKSNTGYWAKKLRRNVQRDAQHFAALEEAGWQVLVVWECGVKDAASLKRSLLKFLRD
jgi:DNA mismatch endonuclease (patch repair protein)